LVHIINAAVEYDRRCRPRVQEIRKQSGKYDKTPTRRANL